ncbi:hypothetical protein ACVWWG_007753 [Bradyrhizobium sp. LB7.2]
MSLSGSLIAILPCNDLGASERFYNRQALRVRTAKGLLRENLTPIACCRIRKADIYI